MIALRPRDIALALGLLPVLHMADRIAAGLTAWHAGLLVP